MHPSWFFRLSGGPNGDTSYRGESASWGAWLRADDYKKFKGGSPGVGSRPFRKGSRAFSAKGIPQTGGDASGAAHKSASSFNNGRGSFFGFQAQHSSPSKETAFNAQNSSSNGPDSGVMGNSKTSPLSTESSPKINLQNGGRGLNAGYEESTVKAKVSEVGSTGDGAQDAFVQPTFSEGPEPVQNGLESTKGDGLMSDQSVDPPSTEDRSLKSGFGGPVITNPVFLSPLEEIRDTGPFFVVGTGQSQASQERGRNFKNVKSWKKRARAFPRDSTGSSTLGISTGKRNLADQQGLEEAVRGVKKGRTDGLVENLISS